MKAVPRISIIVPILNGASHLERFVQTVAKTFQKSSFNHELIFVDDQSDDGTQELLHRLATKHAFVKVILRTGQRSTSQCILAGFHNSIGDILVVTELVFERHLKFLLVMIDACINDGGLILAAQYPLKDQGTIKSKFHKITSKFCSSFSRFFLRVKISDPLNETFVIDRKSLIKALPGLSGSSYRFHLELIFHSKNHDVSEIVVGQRNLQSLYIKETLRNSYQYVCQVLGLFLRVPSVEFLSFCVVGSLGLLLHLLILNILFSLGLSFHISNLTAMICAASNNYLLNQFFTFSDIRIQPSFTVKTWLLYVMVTSISLLANTGIASVIYEFSNFVNFASLCGILVGILWNFFVGRFLLRA